MKTVDASSVLSIIDPIKEPNIDANFICYNVRSYGNETSDYFGWRRYFFRQESIGSYLIVWCLSAGLASGLTEVSKI